MLGHTPITCNKEWFQKKKKKTWIFQSLSFFSQMAASSGAIRKTYILLYCAFSCFFVLFVLFEGKKVTL